MNLKKVFSKCLIGAIVFLGIAHTSANSTYDNQLSRIKKSEVGSAYQIFDIAYNDKNQEELSKITRYNTVDTFESGYGIGKRYKPLRIVSPYMLSNQGSKLELTNKVESHNYKTREEKNSAIAEQLAAKGKIDNNSLTKKNLSTPSTEDEIKDASLLFLKSISQIAYPINDPNNYGEFNNLPGFPKMIPSFANDINMHGNPGFLQGGSYVQLAFGGNPQELEPYIGEAKLNAKVIINGEDLENVYVKEYIDSDLATASSLEEILPYNMIIVQPKLRDMSEYMRISNSLKQGMSKPSETLGYSEKENKNLQKEYLHRWSYEETTRELPKNYTYYVFDFGGSWNHPYSIGVAVSPTKDYLVYFYQNG